MNTEQKEHALSTLKDYGDLIQDALRYRWLRGSDWYVGPDDFYAEEEGGWLEDYKNENFSAENLDTTIDKAIERDKLKGCGS